MWDQCGMARQADGLKEALQAIPKKREEFWENVNVLGEGREFNQSLEHAGRVADFLGFAELMCLDALERNESCGGHFRVEYQTAEGEARECDTDRKGGGGSGDGSCSLYWLRRLRRGLPELISDVVRCGQGSISGLNSR